MTLRRKLKLTIVVLLVLGLVAFGLFRRHSSRQVDKALDAIRAQGYPVTLEELDAWYEEPPPGENAADVLLEAYDASVEPWPEVQGVHHLLEQGTLVDRTAPLPPDVKRSIHEYLLVNAVALELTHEGLAMPHCRWPIQCQREDEIEVPWHSKVLRHDELLKLEAILSAEDGDAERACQAMLGTLGLARTLSRVPLPGAYFGRARCLRRGVRALERVLNRIPLTEEQLARLDMALSESEDIGSLRRKIVGERCITVDFARAAPLDAKAPWRLGEPPVLDVLFRAFFRQTGLMEHGLASYLESSQAILDALEMPFPEQHERLEQITPSFALALLGVGVESFNMACRHQSDVAELRAAQLAVAVERYRLAHGVLPEDANALVSEFIESIPEEPCLHEPIRYKQLPSGYVTYSIGSDKEDDGGVEKEKEYMAWVSGDITFTVERK